MTIEGRLACAQAFFNGFLRACRYVLHPSLRRGEVPNTKSSVERARNEAFTIRRKRDANVNRICQPQDSPINRVFVALESLHLLSSGHIPYTDHRVQRTSSYQLAIWRYYTSIRTIPFLFDSHATEVIPASMGPCSLWIKSSMRKSKTHCPFSMSQIRADLSPDPDTRNRPSREKSRE